MHLSTGLSWPAMVLFLSLHFYLAYGQTVNCSTVPFLVHPSPPYCPGDLLTFECAVMDNTPDPPSGSTVWSDTGNSVSDLCTLSHAIWSTNPSRECGPLDAQATETSSADCFISTLTGSATLSLNGTEVICGIDIAGDDETEIGREMIIIIGEAETESVRVGAVGDVGMGDMRNILIHWKTNEEFPDSTSSYVVTQQPADPFGREEFRVAGGSPEFEDQQMELRVSLGVQYSVSVRTDNCNDTQQGEPASTTLLLNVPLPPMCTIEEDDTVSWFIQDPDTIGVDGRVMNYYIFNESDVVTISRTDSVCSNGQCSYPKGQSPEMLRIVAKNAVGNSSGGECSIRVTTPPPLSTGCPIEDLFPSLNSTPDTPLEKCNCTQLAGQCDCTFDEFTVTTNGNSVGSEANVTAVSDGYCVNVLLAICTIGEWTSEITVEKVATEEFLQDWNIALIVIGVLALVIEAATSAVLGTMMTFRANLTVDGILGLMVLVVSVVVVLPVAGPAAIITYCVLKITDKNDKDLEIKNWYRILTAVAVMMKVVTVILYIIQGTYTTQNDFYGEGPLRGDGGVCVPHEPNTSERTTQDVLVVICHVGSLLVAGITHLKAYLWKWGIIGEGTDGESKPKKKKLREDDEGELQTYSTLQHSIPPPTSSTAGPATATVNLDDDDHHYGRLHREGEHKDEDDQYSKLDHHLKKSTLPGHVPTDADHTYGKLNRDEIQDDQYGRLDLSKVTTPINVVHPSADSAYGKLDRSQMSKEQGPEQYSEVSLDPLHIVVSPKK